MVTIKCETRTDKPATWKVRYKEQYAEGDGTTMSPEAAIELALELMLAAKEAAKRQNKEKKVDD